jgi:hypothetical protein
MRGPFQQRVRIRIVGRVRIRAEDCRTHVDVEVGTDLAQTSATLGLQRTSQRSSPQVLARASGLELAGDGYRSYKVKIQPLECRVIRLQLANGLDGTSLQIPDVHSEHSRLN